VLQFVQWKLFDGTAALKENPQFKQQLASAVPDKSIPLVMMCRCVACAAGITTDIMWLTRRTGLPSAPFPQLALQRLKAIPRTTSPSAFSGSLTRQQVSHVPLLHHHNRMAAGLLQATTQAQTMPPAGAFHARAGQYHGGWTSDPALPWRQDII
jgi:hypothetical protein